MNTAAGDPFAPFEAWTAKEMADAASGAPRPDRTRRFTFTPATAKVYRTIWKGWITWLASEGLQWNQATSAQVRQLGMIPPGAGAYGFAECYLTSSTAGALMPLPGAVSREK